MRRKLYSAILVVLLAGGLVAGLLQPALSQAAFDLTVYPAKLELQVAAGTGLDFGIHIRNTGGESQTMRIYFNDYSIKPNNDFVFEPPGHYSYSCAKWLQAENASIVVPVGKTVATGFRVNVPPKAEPGGHYGVIFFEQQPPPGNANVKAMPRIGSLILVTVPGAIIREGDIKSVTITSTWFWPAHKVPGLPRRKVTARIVFYNSGNVHLTVRGSLTYKASFGWGAGKVEFQEITVLPKTTRYLQTDIPDPPLVGSYKILAKVEYGPSLDVFDTTKVGKGSFSEYPLSLLLLLVVVLAIIALPITIHYGRKKSAEESEKPPESKEEKTKAGDSEEEGEKEPGPDEQGGGTEADSDEAELEAEEKPSEEAGAEQDTQRKFLRSLAEEAGVDGGGGKKAEEGASDSETPVYSAEDEGESDKKSTGEGAVKPTKRWFKGRRKWHFLVRPDEPLRRLNGLAHCRKHVSTEGL